MFRIVINTLLQSGGLILFFSMMLFGFNRQFVSANPIILDQIYHTGTSEIFTYDEIESSVLSEVGLTGGLSRVLSKEKVGSDGEVLGAVASVAAKTSTSAFKHSYKYASRIRARALQDPVAHNFPYSFDDVILKVKPITQADGSLLFRKAGTLNGKSGFFEIGLNPNTKTIFHRTFVGAK